MTTPKSNGEGKAPEGVPRERVKGFGVEKPIGHREATGSSGKMAAKPAGPAEYPPQAMFGATLGEADNNARQLFHTRSRVVDRPVTQAFANPVDGGDRFKHALGWGDG
jgi:hypothetical protein